MDAHKLSPDTQAILLLCGSLGKPRSTEAPLTQAEYHRLALSLHSHQMRPADLLQPDGLLRLQDAEGELLFDLNRLARLLNRGAALALAVESWTNKGLWVLSRSDSQYPQRIKARLGRESPPIFYGVGNRDLLSKGGLAIVGSRDVDEEGVSFTHAVARTCAEQRIQVVSGGARGVDIEAMQGALAEGGTVVGVLADSLVKAGVAGKYRNALRQKTLVLISAYNPDAGFSVGNAMSRNKYVYGMSDYALVISASLEQGGTWAGAVENLTHSWVPLFVRSGALVPEGNRRLLDMGAFAIDQTVFVEQTPFGDWLAEQTNTGAVKHLAVGNGFGGEDDVDHEGNVASGETRQPLHHIDPAESEISAASRQSPSPTPSEHEVAAARSIKTTNGAAAQYSANSSEATRETAELQQNISPDQQEVDLFTIILPYLEQTLSTPRTDREVADLLKIELEQARSWLQRAIESGQVRKLTKPVRYIAQSRTLSMF